MSSIKPDTHPIFPTSPSSEPQQQRKSILWDVVLLVAITVALGFVAMRVQASTLPQPTGGVSLERLAADNTQTPSPTETSTVAELTAALKDPDPNVRMRAAQALGWRRAAAASNALLAATFDPDAHVQEEATVALGEIGDMQALPRLEQLETTQDNLSIQLAAYAAEAQLTEHIAANLKIPRSVVQTLATAQNGASFAAASDELFRLDGTNSAWQDIGPLPDSPTQLSVAPDGKLVYMGTVASGLFRSMDGGHTWSPVSLGSNVSARVTATAVVVNPRNTRQIYVALAEVGPDGSATNPHGVIVSQDGGKTWHLLTDSPTTAVTRRLLLDPTTPNSLYGVTDEGPFRYDIGPNSSSYHTD